MRRGFEGIFDLVRRFGGVRSDTGPLAVMVCDDFTA